jgi:DNA-binding NarL/FixJ family response regulator
MYRMMTIVAEQVFNEEDIGLNGLAPRELELIRYLKQGLSSRGIAIQMNN